MVSQTVGHEICFSAILQGLSRCWDKSEDFQRLQPATPLRPCSVLRIVYGVDTGMMRKRRVILTGIRNMAARPRGWLTGDWHEITARGYWFLIT